MSIRVQLLWPMLSVVALAMALASAAIIYLQVTTEARAQSEHLRRVVETLTQGSFPLSEPVLRQMSGLSGGQFVALGPRREVLHGTIPLADADRRAVGRLDEGAGADAPHVVAIEGRPYRARLVPVDRRAGTAEVRWLVVLQPRDRWWAAVREAAGPVAISAGAALLVVVLVTIWLAGRFVRPIQALGNQAVRIADGCFEPIPAPRRRDEIADLAGAINRMTERLSHFEREVRQSERMRTLGQLGAGIAHQMRNAATGARMAVELLQRHATAPADAESAEVALRQLRLMESHLQRFLAMGRPRPAAREPVALGDVIDDAVDLVEATCRHVGIALARQTPDEPVIVEGDRMALRDVVMNLVLNAVEALGRHGGGAPRIVIVLEPPWAGRARLSVRDTGPGPEDAIERSMFEPFVTSKPDGTGLGLYVAARIAEDHDGSLGWERREDMTCFTLELPIFRPETLGGTPPK
ncbi:MAG: HAMP domain-containing histidine kinase [Pirellulales bacterium]|nr:HAMP domain-containing histidine kinase [Pirellulales bacterium]